MKNVILVFALLIVNAISSQIKVKVNDNLIAENALIKTDEIKKFEIGFEKPKLLKDYGFGGEVTLEISLKYAGDYISINHLTKSGTNAIEAFLEEGNTFYILYEEEQLPKDFVVIRNFLKFINNKGLESTTLKIELYFREKIGYEKFGDPINLLKPLYLKVDNKLNLEEYNKAVAEKKAQEQKVSDEKEKKEEKKSSPILRKLFGR